MISKKKLIADLIQAINAVFAQIGKEGTTIEDYDAIFEILPHVNMYDDLEDLGETAVRACHFPANIAEIESETWKDSGVAIFMGDGTASFDIGDKKSGVYGSWQEVLTAIIEHIATRLQVPNLPDPLLEFVRSGKEK